MRRKFLISLLAVLFFAIEKDIPDQPFDLQEALITAEHNDIIEIPRGTYVLTATPIEIYSKDLTIKAKPPANASNTIIDFGGTGPGLFFWLSNSVIEDLTFKNAYSSDWGGAIVLGAFSNAELRRCVFSNNNAVFSGAAIYLFKSNPLIENCVFKNNKTDYAGGALFLKKSSPIINSSLFFENYTTFAGGAVYSDWASVPTIQNCTFVQNYSESDAGGLFVTHSSSTIDSNILWGNQPNQVNESVVSFNFCNIEQQIVNGEFIILSEPLFIDNQFHINESSPCFNAGNPKYLPGLNEYDLDGNLRLVGPSVDIGCYEVQ